MDLEWRERVWDGPLQYEDVATGKLMMLPSDMALRTDAAFAVYARKYADDEASFFRDFSAAFSKLLALNTPEQCQPTCPMAAADVGAEFREYAMHGSLEKVQKLAAHVDVNATDASSGRTALHKAAFWGHTHVVSYLIDACKVNLNPIDFNGDTPLHDAARFAHEGVVDYLLMSKADISIRNKDGRTPLEVALEYSTTSTANKHDAVIEKLRAAEEAK